MPVNRLEVRRALAQYSATLLADPKQPRVAARFERLKRTLYDEALRTGGPAAAAKQKQRIADATERVANADVPERALAILREAVGARAHELFEGAEWEPPIEFRPTDRTGAWTLEHQLLTIRCVEETPPSAGEDDMLFNGVYAYNGPDMLKSHYDTFDEQDPPRSLRLTLARAQLVPGTRTYTALHFVTEEDVLSEAAAQTLAVIVTALLDLLVEAGMQAARAMLSGWMAKNRPDGVPSAEWDGFTNNALDELFDSARDAGDDLLGIFSEWLSEALGPERFPLLVTEAKVNWAPPRLPVVTGIRAIGSGTLAGAPANIRGAGTSDMLGVPLRRSGGGCYELSMKIEVHGIPGNGG